MAAIKGYRKLSEEELDAINAIKEMEVLVACGVAELYALPGVNQRDLALARTHFEDGCIRAVRAVARPVSPWE